MGRDVSTTGRRQFATTRWSLVLAASAGPSAQAGPARGRFRSFLLTSMQNFLASEWRRQAAVKRGGDVTIVSIDYEDAETRYQIEPAHALTPEAIYERRWALALLERAVDDRVTAVRGSWTDRAVRRPQGVSWCRPWWRAVSEIVPTTRPEQTNPPHGPLSAASPLAQAIARAGRGNGPGGARGRRRARLSRQDTRPALDR